MHDLDKIVGQILNLKLNLFQSVSCGDLLSVNRILNRTFRSVKIAVVLASAITFIACKLICKYLQLECIHESPCNVNSSDSCTLFCTDRHADDESKDCNQKKYRRYAKFSVKVTALIVFTAVVFASGIGVVGYIALP